MAYFHEKAVRSRGGRKFADRIKVIGETLEEQRALQINYPNALTVNWPDRRKGYKSRSLPQIWLNKDRRDILEELDSAEVDGFYISLLTMKMRRLFWEQFGLTDEMKKWFTDEIRGKAIDLWKNGLIKDTENLGLQKLNLWIENLDLGRRNDLKRPDYNPQNTKYDRDKNRTDLNSPLTRLEETYKNGSPDQRTEIENQLREDGKPWLVDLWRSRYP